MYQYATEAFVASENPTRVRSAIIEHMASTFQPLGLRVKEGQLCFDEGRAIIKSVSDGLMLWVGAEDSSTCIGIQTLLNASIHFVCPNAEAIRRWSPASAEPFRTVRNEPTTETLNG